MPSVNITTMTTDHENVFFLFLGGAIELLISLAAIPVSLVNLCLVARTSVIHPNMKAILIFQSFLILLRAFCRGVICLFKFIFWDPIGAESMHFFPFLAIFNFIGIYGRNFVPHILIIERILATLLVRTYEQFRGYLFTMIWSPIAMTITVFIAFSTSPQSSRPLTNVITIVIQLVVGIVEFAMFYQLCQYNSKIYQKIMQKQGYHSLSLRYQLSENIRIGKQLVPPLLLHLLTIVTSTVIISWSYFQWPHYYQMYNLLSTLNAVTGFLIELFIITCHPFLRRDMCQIWNNFGKMFLLCPNNRRIADQTATAVANFDNRIVAASNKNTAAVGIAQRDLISGKALIIDQPKSDEHFAMLLQAWESHIKLR